jgi:ParB family transcriptional regulator, chromosome partitioning protein
MVNKKRPSAASFLSTSAKAHDTEKNLLDAQEKIISLEQELASASKRLQDQVGQDQVTKALVPINDISNRPYNSRREKDPQKFSEILHSIQTYGFRGSIWVQLCPDGTLRLIAGETRLNAAIAAGLQEISADVIKTNDITAVKLSRIENSRRKDLNALDDTEELIYLLMLTLQKDRTQTIECLYRYKNAAEGKSSITANEQEAIESTFAEVAPDISLKTFITSRLPLLNLPDDVLQAYNSGQLEYTKAMILGRVQEDEIRQNLIQEVVETGLSLAALKTKIKPTSGRTVIDRVKKVHQQIDGLNSKSITQMSAEQQEYLKESLLALKASVLKKLRELS